MSRSARRPHPSLLLSWLILGLFTVAFLLRGNREFLLYAGTLTVLIAVVQRSDRAWHFPGGVKWCFLVWLILHMCGGFVHAGGIRLYDCVLLPLVGPPYYILRYDQFVHAFCYFVIGGLLCTVVSRVAATHAPRGLVSLLVFLGALGLGAVNEIIEFSAVAAFGSAGVGDYTNNALDNVFNAVGAMAAMVWRLAPGPRPRHNASHARF